MATLFPSAATPAYDVPARTVKARLHLKEALDSGDD
jgi:hypothetical protein